MNRTKANFSAEDAQRFCAELERRRLFQIVGLAIVVVVAITAVLIRLTGGTLFGLPFSFWGPIAAASLLAKIIFLLVSCYIFRVLAGQFCD